MKQYKVTYTWRDWSNAKVKSEEVYYADSAREAADNCQKANYDKNDLLVINVEKWSIRECWVPMCDALWK